MKMLLIFSVLLNTGLIMPATPETIILPSSDILKERLVKIGLNHFVEITALHQKLGAQELYPLGVKVAVDLALYDYAHDLKNPMVARIMQMRNVEILKTILQDYPDAIAQLEEKGLLS